MKASSRVLLIVLSIMVTVIYSMLIAIDSDLAQTCMIGYCGLILTFVAADNLGRRKDGS